MTHKMAGFALAILVLSGSAHAAQGNVAGIIGQNVLGIGDAEYDLANGVIRVMVAKNCRGQMLAYWARSEAVGSLEIEPRTPTPHSSSVARSSMARTFASYSIPVRGAR